MCLCVCAPVALSSLSPGWHARRCLITKHDVAAHQCLARPVFPRSASLCVCRAFGCSLAAVACLDSQTVGSLLPEQVVMYAFEVLDRKLDVVLAGVRECADVVAGLKAPAPGAGATAGGAGATFRYA